MIVLVSPGSGVLPFTELALDANGDIAVPMAFLRGIPAVVQRIKVRLRFFLGEWFLDTRQGIPFREFVLIKNPRLPVVNAIFQQAIQGTPGVTAVDRCTITNINAKRIATLEFLARLTDGSVIQATNEPFIIKDL